MFLADEVKGTELLPAVVTLNGAQVPAGIYELTLETQGSAVRVTLLKDGEFVATAPGVWVKTGIKYSEDEALLRVNPEGSRSHFIMRNTNKSFDCGVFNFHRSSTPIYIT